MFTWVKHLSNAFVATRYMIKLSLVHLYSFVNCFNTNSESPFISTCFAPSSSKISNPVIKASYSASLLEQNWLSRNLNFDGTPLGETIRIPIHVPFLWLDPWKYNFQGWLSATLDKGFVTE
jgi:hypothetical protein